MDLGVNLSDYQISGPGEMSAADLAELQKALNAGSITGRDTTDLTTASGAPLKVESLENTLKVLTFKESDIVLWQKIPKLPAYNTVEEYNQLQDYGRNNFSFNNEGELPEEDDATYVRRAQLVKFMGTTKVISHPMQLVNTMIGNVVQQEIKNGTLKILRDADAGITKANSRIIPQEWNGVYEQQLAGFTSLDNYLDSDATVDLRGKNLSEATIEDAALSIIDNFGDPNLLMAPPKILSNFVKDFHSSKLIQPNTAALTDGIMGQRVRTFMSQYGPLELGYDKFMKVGVSKTLATGSTSSKAPTAPTADAATPKVALTVANTKFDLSDGPDANGLGDYRYAVTALNRFGESGLTNLSTGGSPDAEVTVATGEAVDLLYVDGGGANVATGYRIYRSVKDDTATTAATTTFFPLFDVSTAELAAGFDGAAVLTIRDLNRILVQTDQAFLIENSLEVWSFKQLAPLMKMDLAQLGPATRFMILLYGTPFLYAVRKMVRFFNVGNDVTA